MLAELHIQNLVIVQQAAIRPGEGLTVVSGETGAGKSLLLDALEIVCGGRASADQVGPWGDAAGVTACFQADPELAGAIERGAGVAAEEGQFILRRRIGANGRSQAWINDVPVTAAALRAAAGALVSIHAQHAPLHLADPVVQLRMLDAWGRLDDLGGRYRAAHAALAKLRGDLRDLEESARGGMKELDWLRFQLREIEALGPKPGELAELEARFRLLGSIGEWRDAAAEGQAQLDGDGQGLIQRVARLARRLQDAPEPRLAAAGKALAAACEPLRDAAAACADVAESMDADPAELQRVEERINAWHDLLRKHGPDEAALMAAWSAIAERVALLSDLDGRRDRLQADLASARSQAVDLGVALAKARREAFAGLAKAVHAVLADLGMPKARISLGERPLPEPGPDGSVAQEFAICTNPGFPAGSLAEIASGGETSRIALALAAVLSAQERTPVLVFDEVDSGVGGRLGTAIGSALRRLSKGRTVLCVTHSPQIAAVADRHVVVRKHQGKAETHTGVEELTGDSRGAEIADMLGGGQKALEQARALLADARV